MKKSFCIFALTSFSLALGGCATVSMVPEQTEITVQATVEQSRLREVSNSFIKKAKAENWISPTNGFFNFARRLVDGDAAEKAEARYADTISARTSLTATVLEKISGDLDRAGSALGVVTTEAKSVLSYSAEDLINLRADVISFENSLVTAQGARRSFAEAITIVAKRTQYGIPNAEIALAAFDKTIDDARATANALAAAQSAAAEGQRSATS